MIVDYMDVTVEVTLSSGKVVVCRRIPPGDLELFEDSHVKPKPPMREATAAGGVVELLPDPDDEDYVQRVTEFQLKRQEDLRQMVFDHVEFKEPPSSEEVERLTRWGIEPTKGNLLRHYMADYFVDWLVVRDEVMRISAVTEDEVQRALDRFQRRLGGGVAPDEDVHSEKPVQSRGRKGAGATDS